MVMMTLLRWTVDNKAKQVSKSKYRIGWSRTLSGLHMLGTTQFVCLLWLCATEISETRKPYIYFVQLLLCIYMSLIPLNIPWFYNTSLLSTGQWNEEIDYLMRSNVSDFALTYNKAHRVFANDTNNGKLNKDSSFSDDSRATS